MTRRNRDEQREAERAKGIQHCIELSRTELPINTLYALAQAEELGLEYTVNAVGDINAIDVTITARKSADLEYEDDEVVRLYKIPSEYGYTQPWDVDRLFTLNQRVIEYRLEQKRLADVKVAALNKLSDEEKKVLGLK